MRGKGCGSARVVATRSRHGWWFQGVFDDFDPLLFPYGYEHSDSGSTFRGDHISYVGPTYRVVFEFDSDTATLRGEFWDEVALDREGHLWALRFWDLLRSRDPDGAWSEPPRTMTEPDNVLAEVRRWADGLRLHASDVLAGGAVPLELWVGIW